MYASKGFWTTLDHSDFSSNQAVSFFLENGIDLSSWVNGTPLADLTCPECVHGAMVAARGSPGSHVKYGFLTVVDHTPCLLLSNCWFGQIASCTMRPPNMASRQTSRRCNNHVSVSVHVWCLLSFDSWCDGLSFVTTWELPSRSCWHHTLSRCSN